MTKQSIHPQTGILHVGEGPSINQQHPEAPAICYSTAYVIQDLDDYDACNHEGKGFFYSRTENPTRQALAEAVSYLENGKKSIICASGMAAISTALISLLSSGDHVVANRSIYGETIELFDNLLARYNVSVSYADFTDPEQVQQAITPNTKIIYTEVITNPLIEVIDLREIAKISKKAGTKLIVDSTFTTPFVIRPLDFGADLVIHSLTKFFGGHSDVTAGSITGSTQLIDQITPDNLLLGGCADANSSWLALRSLRTMDVRMRQHLANAAELAKALQHHPQVQYVNHPSLPQHPQHALAKEILSDFGPMLSFRVEDNREKVNKFIHKLKLVKYLGTLGGYRTSLAHPATAFRFEFSPEKLVEMGMHEGLIRLSVGTEYIPDIIADLDQALTVFEEE